MRNLFHRFCRWLSRKSRPAPAVAITGGRLQGPHGMTVSATIWADGDEDRKQTVLFTPGQKPLQVSPKVKEL